IYKVIQKYGPLVRNNKQVQHMNVNYAKPIMNIKYANNSLLGCAQNEKTESLAIIREGHKHNQVRYLSENLGNHELKFSNLLHDYSNIDPKHIHIDDGTLDPIPLLKEGQVDHIMISGMSGVGKSTWIAGYCRQYKKLFPRNTIYLFSRKTDDKVYKDIDMKQ